MKIENYKLKIALALIIFFVFGFDGAKAGLILQKPNYTGLNQGLVGYWSFDGKDMSGIKAYDRSGQGNDGTLTNGPVRTLGKLGQALSFDGTNDYVDAGSPNSLDNLSRLTLSAWVYRTVSGGTSRIVNKDQSTSSSSIDGWILRMNGSGLMFQVVGTDYLCQAVLSNLSLNQWQHVVAVWDGTFNTGSMSIYLNGDKVQTGCTNLGANSKADDSNASVRIGTSNGSADFFGGKLDDVRIYNRVLSKDEIKRLYRIGGTLHANVTISNDTLKKGLVGHWSFDAPTIAGTRANDLSGQGNAGTITGGATKVIGKLGQALSFDGSGDYVSTSALNITTSSATFVAWIKNLAASDDFDGIFYSRDATQAVGLHFGAVAYSSSGKLAYTWNDNDINTWGWNSGLSIPLNKWALIAVAIDPTKAIAFMCQDGDAECSTATNAIAHSSQLLDTGFRIASDAQNEPDRDCNCIIDDARIYNRALSADEIRRLFRIGGTLHTNATISNDTLKKGLVGHWSFDAPTIAGTRANDLSGQGNAGTITGGATKVIGKLGQALSFDGSNDSIEVTDSTSLDITSAITLSAWVNPDAGATLNYDVIVNKRFTFGDPYNNYILGFNAASLTPEFCVSTGAAGTQTCIDASAEISTKSWSHIIGIYDGSFLRMYVNGIAQAPVAKTGSISTSNENLRIGHAYDADDHYFQGKIDEVRVYNRALSADEIKRLYNLGR